MDTAKTIKAITDSSAIIQSVTMSKFGEAVLSVEKLKENPVQWNSKPRAEGRLNKVTITGSMGQPAFVFCALEKNPLDLPDQTTKRLRLLNTSNATNTNQ